MKRALVMMVLGATLATACDTKKEAPKTEPPPTANQPASPQTTLAAYESIRELLAKDQTVGLADRAAELERVARGAKLDQVATAAASLKGKAEDIDAARKAFGDVSRAVVELLVRDPKLRDGRHIFHCPMADGYQKWIQTSDKIENPYMGKKMLACGGKTDWSV